MATAMEGLEPYRRKAVTRDATQPLDRNPDQRKRPEKNQTGADALCLSQRLRVGCHAKKDCADVKMAVEAGLLPGAKARTGPPD